MNLTQPCKPWQGATNKQGYGRVYVPGQGTQLVHRVAWAEEHGPIPAGVVIRHRCDNPPCTQLEHLTDGTQADNVQDAVERARMTGPRTGEQCGRGHTYTAQDWQTSRRGSRVRDCKKCRATTRKLRRAAKVEAA